MVRPICSATSHARHSRHGSELVAAMDPNDSVGVLDAHFPNAAFFTTFEELSAFVQQQADQGSPVDYYSVCSPNHLHEAHITAGLHAGCNVICSAAGPDSEAVDRLIALESASRRQAPFCSCLHPTIIGFREDMAKAPTDTKAEVDLTYITSRGNWFLKSWKGQEDKSGGIANIGIHFFDMLKGAGPSRRCACNLCPYESRRLSQFANARARWLIHRSSDLPLQQPMPARPPSAMLRSIHRISNFPTALIPYAKLCPYS